MGGAVDHHLDYAKKREQPCRGCSRLFFSSTVSDYIPCCILENAVESGRIFLTSFANKHGFGYFSAKEKISFPLMADYATSPALHP